MHTLPPALEPYIAFHRGIGPENTVEALRSGINTRPPVQEFDVHRLGRIQIALAALFHGTFPLYNPSKNLALGHPDPQRPLHANYDHSLADALSLFEGLEKPIPVVDVKPRGWQLKHKRTLDMTMDAIAGVDNQVIVNISGKPSIVPLKKPSPETYMKLESHFVKNSPSNGFLNVDTGRLGALDDTDRHLESLSHCREGVIYSISPLLTKLSGGVPAPIESDLSLAKKYGIKQVRYWGHANEAHDELNILEVVHRTLEVGLEPVIDLAPGAIIPTSR